MDDPRPLQQAVSEGQRVEPDAPHRLTSPQYPLPFQTSGSSFQTAGARPTGACAVSRPRLSAGLPLLPTAKMAASCVSYGGALPYRLFLRGRVNLASRQILWKTAAAELQTVSGSQVRPGRSRSVGPCSARIWSRRRRHLPLLSRLSSDRDP